VRKYIMTYKMKTNKAMRKRFKRTATGQLKRTRPGRRHLLTKKTSKRKMQLRKPGLIDKTMLKTYSMMMGNA
jgi:large subunit ribosomal protein L35